MREVAAEGKPLEGAALKRAEAARAHLTAPNDFDAAAAEAHLAKLLGAAA
jgi:hypothetical protein